MDELKIIWTKIAISQRNEVFAYWNKRNKSTDFSKKINLLIYEKIDLLKNFPLTGVEIQNEDARILHFHNYSLVYKISQSEIYILAFWDNRQNPLKLLEILKLK
jgi:hypothetical protein